MRFLAFSSAMRAFSTDSSALRTPPAEFCTPSAALRIVSERSPPSTRIVWSFVTALPSGVQMSVTVPDTPTVTVLSAR